jgi:hypothetical protein
VRVTASAAAAAVPGPDAVRKSPWASLIQWWDVGQSENDKNRQPGKLSDTLKMAWQLIAQEKKLMGVASFLMVRTPLPWLSCSAAIKPCEAQSPVFSTHSQRAERATDVAGAAALCKSPLRVRLVASLSTHLLHPSASQGVTPVHRLGVGFFWVAPLHSAGPASSCQT